MRIVLFALVATALAGGGLLGYSHYQEREEARQLERGRECSARLEALYHACERLAFEQRAGASAAWPEPGGAALDAYLDGFRVEEGCPAGGPYYFPATLTDARGTVLAPTCPHADETPPKAALSNRQRGLHTRAASERPADTGLAPAH